MNDISTTDLYRIIDRFQPHAAEPIYSLLYQAGDFAQPESKQVIGITYGTQECKAYYPTLLHFWVSALYSYFEDSGADVTLFADTVRQSQCIRIAETDMQHIVMPLVAGLKQQAALTYTGRFVQAMHMFRDNDFQAIVGETDQHYFAFCWERTE